MTTVRQIYQLQELDQEISRLQSVLESLEAEIGDRSDLERLEEELSAARDRAKELGSEQRRRDMDAESVRQKLDPDRKKLYGGTVINPREVESLEKEVNLLQAELQRREESLLEAMMALEERQAVVAELEARHRSERESWQARQEELTDQWQEQGEALEEMEARRKEWAAALPPQDLNLYESLKASKGGLAMARVERGLCLGCRMALPTHQLQRARISKEPVLCNSCGRILFVS